MESVFRNPVERSHIQGERVHGAVPYRLLQIGDLNADRKFIRYFSSITEAERKIGYGITFAGTERRFHCPHVDLARIQRCHHRIEITEITERHAHAGVIVADVRKPLTVGELYA